MNKYHGHERIVIIDGSAVAITIPVTYDNQNTTVCFAQEKCLRIGYVEHRLLHDIEGLQFSA